MKCSKCGGTGWDVVHGFDCISCDGKGEITMTNEEGLRSATTEELAEVLYRFYRDGRNDELQRYVSINEKSFVKWLKQPHKE